MTPSQPGAVLPLLLMNAFRDLIDELHDELAGRGFPGMRPWHGFALQAIAHGADTASSLGVALGVSKQAAATTIAKLEQDGFVERVAGTDQRARPVRLARRGHRALRESADVLNRIHARWEGNIGAQHLARLERDLAAVTRSDLRTDLLGWLARS